MNKPTINKDELAEWLGLKPNSINMFRSRNPDFPKPIYPTGSTPLWLRAEVETWLTGCPRQMKGARSSGLNASS